MKGGFNKMFRNFAAMKGKTEFDKVTFFLPLIHILWFLGWNFLNKWWF
jgi:hypothetical protein